MLTERIFVQIASYRDNELRKTIESCLATASNPDRLTFGIVNQHDEQMRTIIDEFRSDGRFRIHDMPWQEAKGAGLARYLCNTLYQDETYTLQIDSHMRFAPGWDEDMIAQWNECGDEHAVLSAHPYDFRYDEAGNEQLSEQTYGAAMPVIFSFHNHKVPILKSTFAEGARGVTRKSYFVVGGFIFGPGKMCREVPYEKDVAFMGEEVVYSLKLFTNGYTIYKPARLGIYHLYERPAHRNYWNDMTEEEEARHAKAYHEATTRSAELIVRMIEGDEPDRLGTQRTLGEFERYVGVDFKQKLIHPGMQKGVMPPVAQSGDWTSEVFPEKEQQYTISTQAFQDEVFTSLYVRLYDTYNVQVWGGGIERDKLAGVDSYTITCTARTTPTRATGHILTSDRTWRSVDVTKR